MSNPFQDLNFQQSEDAKRKQEEAERLRGQRDEVWTQFDPAVRQLINQLCSAGRFYGGLSAFQGGTWSFWEHKPPETRKDAFRTMIHFLTDGENLCYLFHITRWDAAGDKITHSFSTKATIEDLVAGLRKAFS